MASPNLVQLDWAKCEDDVWCPLENVNLADVSGVGVYITWCSNGPVVRIGQGDIADRLTKHRNDPRILAYRSQGELLTTWAIPGLLGQALVNGIERYLADRLNPRVGCRFPDDDPVPVGLPF